MWKSESCRISQQVQKYQFIRKTPQHLGESKQKPHLAAAKSDDTPDDSLHSSCYSAPYGYAQANGNRCTDGFSLLQHCEKDGALGMLVGIAA